VQPEEVFWRKYSPHHEALLSGVGSFVVHGLVVGILFLAGLSLLWARQSEELRPPNMDAVMVEGGGDGFEGGGSEPAADGSPDGSNKTENVDGPPKTPQETPIASKDKLEDPLTPPQFDIPPVAGNDAGELVQNAEVAASLQEISAEVERDMKIVRPKKSVGPVGTPNGTGKKTGKGGLGGNVGGPGKGNKKGPGTGTSGGFGRKKTKQEILAWRWRFDLSGDGKEHADKLDAMGVTLAFADQAGKFLVARNLKRRPVDARRESLEPYKDAVKWYNTRAESILGLAREIQLPFVPRYVVLLLPKEREEKMAEAERRYAESRGRKVSTVSATWFDFRPQNGAYEPVVIRQE
jgi:hypothetical protein